MRELTLYELFTMINAVVSAIITAVVIMGFAIFYAKHGVNLLEDGVTHMLMLMWYSTMFITIQVLFGPTYRKKL